MEGPVVPKWRARARQLLTLAFWAGLALCAFALAQYSEQSLEMLSALNVYNVLLLAAFMVAAWVAAVASWRCVVRATGVEALSFSDCARHLALLLIGKYLPGGIWGFVARFGDSARSRPPWQMLVAGITEQWLGLASVSLMAAGLWLASRSFGWWILLLTPAVPVISAGTWKLFARGVIGAGAWVSPRIRKHVDTGAMTAMSPRPLLAGAAFTSAQVAMQMLIVGAMAFWTTGTGLQGSLAIAAYYGIGIAVGMLAIIAPGGILVREGTFVALSSAALGSAEAVTLAAALRLIFTGFDLMAGALVMVVKPGRE